MLNTSVAYDLTGFPLCVLQMSGHNVTHEAITIKKMLELGLIKNLTHF